MAQTKKTYDFKSVGENNQTYNENVLETVKKVPIGIASPISFDDIGVSTFKMTTTMSDAIKDNLKNLISTNKGERLLLVDFGANLIDLALELSNEDIAGTAGIRIAENVAKYMPFVQLETFEPRIEKDIDDNIVRSVISITYSVPDAGLFDQKIEAVILSVG